MDREARSIFGGCPVATTMMFVITVAVKMIESGRGTCLTNLLVFIDPPFPS
ncbi:hypothetical protein [Luteimonas arsenica]|uniref:hypothetical protein n=1 Tax=Luteimonas arsenica TaxID=1586242 RepID=UPI001404715E|nr:hypothetical protein [Luteimonas arsenica]